MSYQKVALSFGAELELELRTKDGIETIYPDEVGVYGVGPEYPVGVDGSGNVAEIRTRPGTPDWVFRQILQLKKELEDKISARGCMATPFALRYPVGLHIHFGAQPQPDEAVYERWVKFMMEVGRLHQSWNPYGRLDSSYGDIDDYRYQPWGIEYRALPATVVASPEHLYKTLRFAQIAASAAISGAPITYPKWWEAYRERAMRGPRIPTFYIKGLRREVAVYDEWHPENRDAIRQFLEGRESQKLIEALQRKCLRPIEIILIGLRQERGVVYGARFNIPGASIPRCHDWEPGGLMTLGLPWEWRNTPTKEARDNIIRLVRAFLHALEDNLPWLFQRKQRKQKERMSCVG
jgi:hypothetical protein